MQRSLNQRAQALSQICRQPLLGYFHHGGDCHAHAKNRIRFAINCKSSGFSIWGMVFSRPLFIGDWLWILQTENFNPAVFQQLLKSSVARNQKTGLQKIEPLFNEQAISFKIRKKLDLDKLDSVFRVVACSKPSAEFRDSLAQSVFAASYRERDAKHLTMHIVSLKFKQSRKQSSKLT